jgi:hypothetical protein
MLRKVLTALAAILPALLLTAGPASGSSTALSMSLTEADGSTPMANASVSVYYMPFNPTYGSWFWPTRMGSGTTDANGNFSLALDTSMVPTSGLADIGDGSNDGFNAVVFAMDPNGNYVQQNEVLELGTTTTDTASAHGTGGLSQPPIQGSTPPGNTVSGFTGLSSCACLAQKYRYVPISVENSGSGMSEHLLFTVSSSVTKQTVIGSTITYNNGGSWQGNGSFTELSERSGGTDAPWNVDGSYHYFIWANYLWYLFENQYCGHGFCTPPNYEWLANSFAGQVSVVNPNWEFGVQVGTVPYGVPSYTHNPNFYFPLNINNSGWGRSSGTRTSYSAYGNFQFPADIPGVSAAIDVGLSSEGTYGSITYAHWYVLSGGCNATTVIWGDNIPPAQARTVQANCYNPV